MKVQAIDLQPVRMILHCMAAAACEMPADHTTLSLKCLKWLFSHACCFAQLNSVRQWCTSSCRYCELAAASVWHLSAYVGGSRKLGTPAYWCPAPSRCLAADQATVWCQVELHTPQISLILQQT